MGRIQRAMPTAVTLILLVTMGLGSTGCAAGPPASPVKPAYTPGSAGSASAVGYLSHSGLEGGFWAVYDAPLSPSSAVQPRILAVLLSGSVDEPAVAALNGRYIRASGRIAAGASIRMAGPEILVDGIDIATPPGP